MADVQASVLKLEQSPTKAGKARWLLGLSNGETVTIWDAPLADQANKIPQGATATFSYDTTVKQVQDGRSYTNHTLRGIVYTGAEAAPKVIPQAAPSSGGGMSAEDKERVSFLSLFSSTAAIHSGLGDVEAAWDAAVGLHKRLFPKAVTEAPVASAGAVGEDLQTFGSNPTTDGKLPWS